MRWSDVTALFGGTFDPPHAGHREVIEGLFEAPGVRRVVVIPTASPPHKSESATAAARLEMARLAFGDRAEVSAAEIDRARRTGARSYTFDTLQELGKAYGEVAFVIGTDQLVDLPRWYRFPEVLGLAHWIVLERKPFSAESLRKGLHPLESSGLIRTERTDCRLPSWRVIGPAGEQPRFLVLAPTPARALSSREVREELGRTGSAPTDALAPEVAAYLKQNRLYGSSGERIHDER